MTRDTSLPFFAGGIFGGFRWDFKELGGIRWVSVGFGGFQWDFRGAQWDVCLFAVLCGNVGPPLVSCSLETG